MSLDLLKNEQIKFLHYLLTQHDVFSDSNSGVSYKVVVLIVQHGPK
jgi:hypothetical protein